MSRHSTRSDRGVRDHVDEHVEQAVREFPGIDAAVEAVVARIDKLGRYLEKSVSETMTRHGLNEGEYKVLVKLRLAGPPFQLSPGELSDALLLSTGAMTNRLDRLEEDGLVRRRSEPRDRRGILVELTPRGRTTLDAAIQEQAAREVELLGVLSDREKATLNDALRKLMLRFDALMGPPPRRRDRAEG
jgi:DNA-binding MarR family transcriptional regulator